MSATVPNKLSSRYTPVFTKHWYLQWEGRKKEKNKYFQWGGKIKKKKKEKLLTVALTST